MMRNLSASCRGVSLEEHSLRWRFNDSQSPGIDAMERGCYDSTAGWSSLVARWAHNPKVVGSNPTPATKRHHKFAGTSAVVPSV
jgi:hypothetical protein